MSGSFFYPVPVVTNPVVHGFSRDRDVVQSFSKISVSMMMPTYLGLPRCVCVGIPILRFAYKHK